MLLTCKQVSDALAKERYYEMTPWRRFLVRFHVLWCFVCGKFNKQVIFMQDVARHYREHEQQDPPTKPVQLSDDCKQRLRDALKSKGG